MHLDEQVRYWNRTAIKILDIRHVAMDVEDIVESYLFPANGYLYAIKGTAVIELDGRSQDVEQGYVLHGGKGSLFRIQATEYFEYYLLFYRAVMAFNPSRNIWQSKQQESAISTMQYAFAPERPLGLKRYLNQLATLWDQADDLDRLQAKGIFYQFVHELMLQMVEQEVIPSSPDPVKQALFYIQNHYREPITLDGLAEQINYSGRHLSLQFKQRTGYSPIDYVIQMRLAEARSLLESSNATLSEIAAEVGYGDVYYFGRIFKKHVGIAPIRYQQKIRQQGLAEDRPFHLSGLSIGWGRKRRYIDYENHYQYINGGSTVMKQRKTASSMIWIALLTLTMLLSACSNGATSPAATGDNAGASTNASSTASMNSTEQENTVNGEQGTRTVSTIKGDVVVPADPKRVVVLYLQGDVVALGVKPVGTSDVFDGAAYKSELEGVSSLGTWFEPNPEAVIDLDPDLIIVPSEATYDLLKDVAPTVYVPYEKMSTEERLQYIASIFGKEKEAETLLADFDKKVEESKVKLADAGIMDKTVTIVEGGMKGMAVVESKQFGRGSQVVYEYLGLKAPEVVQQKIDVATTASGSTVSMEVLPEYVGDYVFRSVYEGADNLTDNPVWSNILAVKEGRLIEIDFNFFYYSDIYSLDKQLDFVMDQLLNVSKTQ